MRVEFGARQNLSAPGTENRLWRTLRQLLRWRCPMACVWDPDLASAAMLTIKYHGDAAVQFAADSARNFAAQGDDIGAETWRQIAMAVAEIQRPEPMDGERIN